jgi:beta-lactamase class A
MDPEEHLRSLFDEAGCEATFCAEPLTGGPGLEIRPDEPVTPASVIKVLVAQAALNAMARDALDPTSRVRIAAAGRTPGPVGLSLLDDDVELSMRDLVPLMLTISDNPATDALVSAVGLDTVNHLAADLGLEHTRMTSDLMTMLDAMATEAGFADYAALASYEPVAPGDPSADEIRVRLAATAALDPSRGTRTTARDCIRLLRSVWRDQAGPADACRRLRMVMGRQLTQQRIAAGFGADVPVAAKSGGLMGVVRNEIGVVQVPAGRTYAVAAFTRCDPSTRADARMIDAAIGRASAYAVGILQG